METHRETCQLNVFHICILYTNFFFKLIVSIMSIRHKERGIDTDIQSNYAISLTCNRGVTSHGND